MMTQLNTLAQELGTGQAAQTYSGLGSQAGVAVALGAQLSDVNGYASTATSVGTTLSVALAIWLRMKSGRVGSPAAVLEA